VDFLEEIRCITEIVVLVVVVIIIIIIIIIMCFYSLFSLAL